MYVERKQVPNPSGSWGVKDIVTEYSGRSVFEKLYNSIEIKYSNIYGEIHECYGIKSALKRTHVYPSILFYLIFPINSYFRNHEVAIGI